MREPVVSWISKEYVITTCIGQGTARQMGNSFGSSLWMLPISPHCHADPKRCQKFLNGESPKHYVCDAEQQSSNHSGWPVDVVTIETPAPPSGSHPLYLLLSSTFFTLRHIIAAVFLSLLNITIVPKDTQRSSGLLSLRYYQLVQWLNFI